MIDRVLLLNRITRIRELLDAGKTLSARENLVTLELKLEQEIKDFEEQETHRTNGRTKSEQRVPADSKPV